MHARDDVRAPFSSGCRLEARSSACCQPSERGGPAASSPKSMRFRGKSSRATPSPAHRLAHERLAHDRAAQPQRAASPECARVKTSERSPPRPRRKYARAHSHHRPNKPSRRSIRASSPVYSRLAPTSLASPAHRLPNGCSEHDRAAQRPPARPQCARGTGDRAQAPRAHQGFIPLRRGGSEHARVGTPANRGVDRMALQRGLPSPGFNASGCRNASGRCSGGGPRGRPASRYFVEDQLVRVQEDRRDMWSVIRSPRSALWIALGASDCEDPRECVQGRAEGVMPRSPLPIAR